MIIVVLCVFLAGVTAGVAAADYFDRLDDHDVLSDPPPPGRQVLMYYPGGRVDLVVVHAAWRPHADPMYAPTHWRYPPRNNRRKA